MSAQNVHGLAPTHSFGRLFENLQPLIATPDELRILALSMRDNNNRLPASDERAYAGLTYLGQFVDHDLTREKATPLNSLNIVDVNLLNNERTSWFDLDSLFGEFNQYLNEFGLFNLSKNLVGEDDLPRNPDGTAFIGDPRNEENVITAGLHLLFLKFYNKVFNDIKLKNPTFILPQLIIESKKIVQWHYQIIVIEQYLKDITGKYYSRFFDTVTRKTNVHPAIKNLGAKLPIEFSGAVYRFGHTLVRNGYYINEKFDLFPLFDPVVPDLRGFKPLNPNQTIDWSMFFPMPYTKGFQEWEGIDPFIVNSLFQLPPIVAIGEPILPLRSMTRGSTTYGLPSGQDLARAFGLPEEEILSVSKGNLIFESVDGILAQNELDLLNLKFGESTPLFYYILREAWVYSNGNALGPLGSLIVGGVFLNLLELNQDSYLNNNFVPVAGLFGCVNNGEYYINELITYALNLRPFNVNTIIPDEKTNFFDQHSVNQFSIALGIVHALQPTIQPDLIQEFPIIPPIGWSVDAFDPTVILGTATQAEVDTVALNAVSNGLNSVYAVVKFISNKNIQAIAQNLIAPFAKKVRAPLVNPPFVLPVEEIIPAVLTRSQLRGRALCKTLNESLRYTQQEALSVLPQIEQEINDALTGIPPIVIIENFINSDIITN